MSWQHLLGACPIGFGTMAIGGQHAGISDEAAVETIVAAAAAGVRLFDTAPQYGCGLAEERLGLALASIPRDTVLVATKVGKQIAPLGSGGQRQRDGIFQAGHDREMIFDYSYDGTLRILEDSLRRLGLSRVDLVLIHDITRHFHGEAGIHDRVDEAMRGALAALRRLRDEGVIAAIGTGLKDTDVAARFVEEAAIDVVLLPGRMSLLDQSGATSGLFDLCVKHDVAVIAAAPFDSGILATGSKTAGPFGYKPADSDTIARVAAIEVICARHGAPLQAAALQYPRRHAAVATTLCGMRHKLDVAENMLWANQSLPDALWDDLNEVIPPLLAT